MKRVIVGGISHETSTFTPVVTTRQSYHERFLLRGGAIPGVLRGTNTPIGGFIDGADKHGYDWPMFAGLESNLGPSAHIEQDGIRRLYPFHQG